MAAALGAREPQRVIFDTDIGNDIDDALALAMLHAMESRGEVRLLAVTITKDNPWAPRAASAIDTFYCRGSIPIGTVRNGVTRDDGTYNRVIADRHPHAEKFEEAVPLLRRTLETQPDASVVIVQVGFSTNLAALLGERGGRELAARKVKQLVVMAGHFTDPAYREYNVKEDVAAAKKLFEEWPTEIVASGFEIGLHIKYPARSIENDFAWTTRHPVVDGYRAYMKMPYDRETWDLTAVLYAVRPSRGYFGLSSPGTVRVQPRGETTFEPSAQGLHRFLTVDDVQRARILEVFLALAAEPACYSRK